MARETMSVKEKVAARLAAEGLTPEVIAKAGKEEDPLPEIPIQEAPSEKKKRAVKLSESDVIEFEDTDEYLADALRKAREVEDIKAKMQAMADETEGVRSKAQGELDAINKWKTWQNKSTKDKLDEMFAAEGGYEKHREAIIEEYKKLASMTEVERKAFEDERARVAALRRVSELEERIAKQGKELEEKAAKVRKEEIDALYRRVFREHSYANQSKDESIDGVNELIYTKASSSIKALRESGANITEAVLHREFKAAKDKYSKLVPKSTQSAKEQVDAQLAANKDASPTLNSSVAPTSTPDSETVKRWSELRKAGKMKEIVKELTANPEKQGLFERFMQRVIGAKW